MHFILWKVYFFVAACEKTEDTVMKNLTFPSEITFYQLEDETVLSITNSGSRSLMLNFTFDEIVAVSNHPRNILLAVYPATGQTKEVLLNSNPLSMHLSNALGKVVVGQTDRFTIVDLASFAIVKETQTDMDVSKVFMPNADWLFATPEYPYMRRININTGEITVNSRYGLIKLKQHPFRENALLGSVMNLHPSMMDVYDITKFDLFGYEAGGGISLFINQNVAFDVALGYASVRSKYKTVFNENATTTVTGFGVSLGFVVVL